MRDTKIYFVETEATYIMQHEIEAFDADEAEEIAKENCYEQFPRAEIYTCFSKGCEDSI